MVEFLHGQELDLNHRVGLCLDEFHIPICEGVETAEQVEFLLRTECQYAQGYFYGKAMALAEDLALPQQSVDKPQAALPIPKSSAQTGGGQCLIEVKGLTPELAA
ncbi:EAL domain-containing protein [bacterium]|nr:EAL domain-containing protein [bacterium]